MTHPRGQHHALHLPRDDLAPPLTPTLIHGRHVQQLNRISDRRERIAQLVGEGREEFILAPVGLAQGLFRALQTAYIQIDSGPTPDFAILRTDRNALGENGTRMG